MKLIITLCIICTLLSGCSYHSNKIVKTERSWQIFRKDENGGQVWKSRQIIVDYDNQSGGNATDKALRSLKKSMRL